MIAHARGELTLVTCEPPPPPPRMTSRQVVHLRQRFRMSQAMFAATLNVSPQTVQSWEQGVRHPSDVAMRMLQILDRKPEIVAAIFS